MAKLLVAGFALLALAWAFTNPPGAGPDEAANYVKAVGVGQGDLLGERGPLPAAEATPFTPDQLRLAWSRSTTRWVRVPAALTPAGFTQRSPRSKTEPTYVGTYQPFIYILPGLTTRLAGDPISALLIGRLTTAALCVGLLATALWLLARPGRIALGLVGMLVAVTPLVIFLTAVVSASGFEICAGICVFAAVLRLSRSEAPTRAVFIALVVAGVVLALSRPLGVIWLGLDLALLLPLVGWTRLIAMARSNPRTAVLGGLALAAAVTLGTAWELAVEPHHHTTLAEIGYFVPRAIALLPLDLKQAIGIFGWLDTWLPAGIYDLAMAAIASLVIGAFILGTRRQRLLLGGLIAITTVVALTVGAAIIMPIGSPLQARYFLAFAVTIPLYAGEVLALNADRLRVLKPAQLVGGFASIAAITQGIALVVNAVTFRGSLPDYARVFTPAGPWQPPLGFIVWLGLGLAGCLLLLGAGATAFRKPAADATTTARRPVAA